MTTEKPGPARRMGPPGSEVWHTMLNGAEDILREEGHAELTSRRIAERIGVKQRLVYYYFHTMDDLVVALFRRLSERELARLRESLQSPHTLREIWDTNVGSTDARLISEFMALANRIEDLRVEVIHFIEEARAIEIEAIEAALKRRTPAAMSRHLHLRSSPAASRWRLVEKSSSASHQVTKRYWTRSKNSFQA